MTDAIQIVTTIDDQQLAARIARELVESRLAACVQVVGPIESVYRWEGRTETATEWQCWIKTATSRYAEVEQAIRRWHSYQVPEIIATPIVAGGADYLRWLAESVAAQSPPP